MEQTPLHWSDRAKMYPPARPKGSGAPGMRPGAPKGGRRTPRKQRPAKSRLAFRIVLAVLFLAAVAAGLYVLFLMPDEEGTDDEAELAARNLVRTAMTTIERAYTDARTYDPRAMAASTLNTLEPSITFHPVADESAASSPTAQAKDQSVNYSGTQTSYAVGTLSESNMAYGVVVDKEADTVTYYLQGKIVENWGTEPALTTSTLSAPETTQPQQAPSGPIAAGADVAAKSVLRNCMTTLESAYTSVLTFDPNVMTPAMLGALEPSITFIVRQDAAKAPISQASEGVVEFFGTATSYSLGTISDSGNSFGVVVTIDTRGRTTVYYRNGEVYDWSSFAATGI